MWISVKDRLPDFTEDYGTQKESCILWVCIRGEVHPGWLNHPYGWCIWGVNGIDVSYWMQMKEKEPIPEPPEISFLA